MSLPTAATPAAAPAKLWRPPEPEKDLHHRAFRFRITETPEQTQAFARITGSLATAPAEASISRFANLRLWRRYSA